MPAWKVTNRRDSGAAADPAVDLSCTFASMRCRRLQRFSSVLTTCCLLLVSGPSAFSQSPLAVDLQSSRLTGVQIGPHRVGFETRTATDGTRRINSTDVATKFGVAIWYPAQRGADRPPMTSLD